MEDVLEVYHRPYEDNEVLVCSNGVSNLFMLFAPLERTTRTRTGLCWTT